MSSVVSFGTNTNAQRKRVKFVNSDSSSSVTIYEGMPLCYQFDTSSNILGIDTGASNAASSTTTDGGHNEGKFLIVDVPYDDNVDAFAGVVASGPAVGKAVADGSELWLDVFIPNGAVVPVRADQNCTEGRTILAVHKGENFLTAPLESGGRPVAVAWETVDAATTTGLVLAKLDPNMFIYQRSDNTNLEIDDEDTGMMVVNKIDLDFKQASGNCVGLWVQAESSAGAASSGYGLAGYFQADVTATPSTHIAGTGIWMNVTGGTPSEYLFPLEVGLYEDGATMTSVSKLSVVSLTHQVANAPTANSFSWINFAQNGAEAADNFITATNLATLPTATFTGDVSMSGQEGIKVYLPNQAGVQQYYIPLLNCLTD